MDIKINSVLVPEQFCQDIEEIVWMADCTYMEAILLYAERLGVEVEAVAAHVKRYPVLKAKLQMEAEDYNLLERTPKLDF
jgi:hypothetical protein